MICRHCSKTLLRIRRHPLQRLLPSTRRFACTDCGRRYLLFVDVLCKHCDHPLTIVPRTRLQRLIPGCTRHACRNCGHRFFSLFGVLLGNGFKPTKPRTKVAHEAPPPAVNVKPTTFKPNTTRGYKDGDAIANPSKKDCPESAMSSTTSHAPADADTRSLPRGLAGVAQRPFKSPLKKRATINRMIVSKKRLH